MSNAIFGAMGATIFETMSRRAQDAGALNLGQGFPEGLEPPALIEAARKALADGPHQYPPMAGLPELRKAIADNARRQHGIEADWESEVFVTSGATEALADCFFGLLNPGDEVLIFEPAYDSYAPIILRAGAKPIPVRLKPPSWDLPQDDIRRAITAKTKALVLNTPMNPIGKVFNRAELEFLESVILEHDLIAICDEVYEHLVYEAQHISLFSFPALREKVLRIGSAGKAFSVTGWKVGFVMADAKLLGPVLRAHQYLTFTTSPALQKAVAFGLSFPQSYFDDLRADLCARKDCLTDGLRKAGFPVQAVAGTYFAVAAIDAFDASGDDFHFCLRLIDEAGVAAVPLSYFYGDRSVKNYIRFCFAKDSQTLAAALERLGQWSFSHRSG